MCRSGIHDYEIVFGFNLINYGNVFTTVGLQDFLLVSCLSAVLCKIITK